MREFLRNGMRGFEEEWRRGALTSGGDCLGAAQVVLSQVSEADQGRSA